MEGQISQKQCQDLFNIGRKTFGFFSNSLSFIYYCLKFCFLFSLYFPYLNCLFFFPKLSDDSCVSCSFFREKKWVTANEQGQFHWYGGFSNGGSADLNNKQISIFGLVLKYDEDDGSLVLYNANYEESKKYFPNLSNLLVNKKLAQVKKKLVSGLSKNKKAKDLGSPSPCNVQWSNGFRFDPSDTDGKCLHFTASTKGILYVIFSAVPSDKETWYYVEISPNKIGIYKVSSSYTFIFRFWYFHLYCICENPGC